MKLYNVYNFGIFDENNGFDCKFVLFFFVVDVLYENWGGKIDVLVDKVNLIDNYVVEWCINEKVFSVEFKINVMVDDKGWVLLGFMDVLKN